MLVGSTSWGAPAVAPAELEELLRDADGLRSRVEPDRVDPAMALARPLEDAEGVEVAPGAGADPSVVAPGAAEGVEPGAGAPPPVAPPPEPPAPEPWVLEPEPETPEPWVLEPEPEPPVPEPPEPPEPVDPPPAAPVDEGAARGAGAAAGTDHAGADPAPKRQPW